MPQTRWKHILAIGVILSIAVGALAQDFRFRGGGQRGRFHVMPNTPYDGRFTFVRLNYETAPGGYWYVG